MNESLIIGGQTLLLIVLGFTLFRGLKKLPKNVAIAIIILMLLTMGAITIAAIHYPETLAEWLGKLNIEIDEEALIN